MSMFPKCTVQTLPEWLETATRKLTSASRERIRSEIEAHYAEAVAAHREDGLSEADAQSKALVELGDAKAAARQFRKRHLTEGEDQTLKLSEKWGQSGFWLILGCVTFVFFAFDQRPLPRNAMIRYRHQSLGLTIEFLIMVAIPTIHFAVARLNKTRPNRHLLLLNPYIWFFLGTFLNQLFQMGYVFEINLDVLSGLAFLIVYLLLFRLWIKLGKTGTLQGQAPPPDIATV